MCSASYVTAVTAAFLVRYSSGYLEVALPNTECVRLGLSSMSGVAVAAQNGTGYTVTVDAASGIGTGISAGDRATTMRRLADPASTAASFTRPGHVQPRVTGAGGSRSRPDYAHAAVDLAGIAQLSPVCGIGHLSAPTTRMSSPMLRKLNGSRATTGSASSMSATSPNAWRNARKSVLGRRSP